MDALDLNAQAAADLLAAQQVDADLLTAQQAAADLLATSRSSTSSATSCSSTRSAISRSSTSRSSTRRSSTSRSSTRTSASLSKSSSRSNGIFNIKRYMIAIVNALNKKLVNAGSVTLISVMWSSSSVSDGIYMGITEKLIYGLNNQELIVLGFERVVLDGNNNVSAETVKESIDSILSKYKNFDIKKLNAKN